MSDELPEPGSVWCRRGESPRTVEGVQYDKNLVAYVQWRDEDTRPGEGLEITHWATWLAWAEEAEEVTDGQR
jgi:hypothetical protein